MNVDVGEQLALELGDQFAPVEPVVLTHAPIDMFVVVCQQCTGHHPTERCPQRVVCSLCTGAHHASSHLGTVA